MIINIDDAANKILETLSPEEIKLRGEKAKKTKMSLYVRWVLVEVCMLAFAIFEFCVSGFTIAISFTCATLLCVIFSTAYSKPARFFKWDSKMWALQSIKEGLTKLDKIKQINGRYIKSVSILDSYTEFTDKLHGFLNYQEIIQTRIYKFKVVFEDGGAQIYTEKENSKLCKQLLSFMEIVEDE